MIEDKLTQEQRIRLESVAQAMHGHYLTDTPEQPRTIKQVLETAQKIEAFILAGKLPEGVISHEHH